MYPWKNKKEKNKFGLCCYLCLYLCCYNNTKMIQINSKRLYTVLICDHGECDSRRLTINKLLNPGPDPYEYINALLELVGLDTILDMPEGASCYFQCNRDDKTSKGILCRVQ